MRVFIHTLLICCVVGAVVATAAPTALTVVTVGAQDKVIANNASDRSNGNSIANANCDMFLVLKNAHASNPGSVIVTKKPNTPNTPGFGSLTLGSLVVTLAAGEVRHVGPFSCGSWNNSAGDVIVEYNATGEVQVSPLRAVRP